MAGPSVPSRRLVVLLTVTALALMTIDARGFGPVQSIRRAVFGAAQPLADGLGWLASPVTGAWNGAVHYDDVVEENALLRLRLAELEGQIEQLPDNELELQQLLAATELEFVENLPRVTARVVADRRTGLERLVEINRGSDHGIEEDMPVVTGDGLVGRVLLTTGDRSVIRLITDPRFSVGVVAPSTGALGVTTGSGDGDDPLIDIEAASLDLVNSGDRFETSGFDRSRYPGGIPVGELIVDEDEDRRTLELFADLDRLTYLTVLLVPEPE